MTSPTRTELDEVAGGELEAGAGGELEAGAGGELEDGAGGDLEDGAGGELEDGAGGELEDGAGGDLEAGAGGELERGAGGELERGAGGELERGAGGELEDGAGGELARTGSVGRGGPSGQPESTVGVAVGVGEARRGETPGWLLEMRQYWAQVVAEREEATGGVMTSQADGREAAWLALRACPRLDQVAGTAIRGAGLGMERLLEPS